MERALLADILRLEWKLKRSRPNTIPTLMILIPRTRKLLFCCWFVVRLPRLVRSCSRGKGQQKRITLKVMCIWFPLASSCYSLGWIRILDKMTVVCWENNRWSDHGFSVVVEDVGCPTTSKDDPIKSYRQSLAYSDLVLKHMFGSSWTRQSKTETETQDPDSGWRQDSQCSVSSLMKSIPAFGFEQILTLFQNWELGSEFW